MFRRIALPGILVAAAALAACSSSGSVGGKAASGSTAGDKAVSGSTDGGRSGMMRNIWTAKLPASSPKPVITWGWADDDTAVAIGTDVVGYRLADGTVRWKVEPPQGKIVCAVSPTTDSGIGIVAFGTANGACDDVAAIDLKTGKQLWDAVQRRGPHDIHVGVSVNVWITGGIVVVQGENTVAGLRAADGTQRWETAEIPDRDFPNSDCEIKEAFAAGGHLVTAAQCDSGPSDVFTTYDTATGSQLWQRTFPRSPEMDTNHFYWADPVVMSSGPHSMSVLGAQGDPLRLDLAAAGFTDVSDQVVIAKDMILLSSPTAAGAAGVNLTTGKVVWRIPTPAGDSLAWIDTDGRTARAAAATGSDDTALVSVSLADGKTSQIAKFPTRGLGEGIPSDHEVAVASGRVIHFWRDLIEPVVVYG